MEHLQLDHLLPPTHMFQVGLLQLYCDDTEESFRALALSAAKRVRKGTVLDYTSFQNQVLSLFPSLKAMQFQKDKLCELISPNERETSESFICSQLL